MYYELKGTVAISSMAERAVTTSVTTAVPLLHADEITQMGPTNSRMNIGDNLNLVCAREAVAWTVAAVSMVLFVVSLAVNITMLWLRYKKRQAKDNNVEAPMYEMEGNPCYEAASVKQTTDSTRVQEVHLYERVNQKYN